MVAAQQPVPEQQELAEIHLGVLEVALVVPAVHLRHRQQPPQRAEIVVQVGVLKREVHGEQGEPGGAEFRRCAEQGQQQ